MPKEITHQVLAEEVYRRMDDSNVLKSVIQRHKPLYIAGSVIVDTPFYYLFGKNKKIMEKSAYQFHNNSDSFAPINSVLRHYEPDIPEDVLALMLGAISHIWADSVFHPMVYYFCENNMYLHRKLETYLDVYFNLRFTTYDLRFKVLNFILPIVIHKSEIITSRILETLSILFFNNLNNISSIKNALRFHAVFHRLFFCPIFRTIFHLLNLTPKPTNYDYLDMNIALFYPFPMPDAKILFQHPFLYQHPVTGENCRKSVTDLENMMIVQTLKTFDHLANAINTQSPADAFSKLRGPNLVTGIPGVQMSEMQYFSMDKNVMRWIF